VQANGTIVALIVFDERLYNSTVHRDKAIKRLRTARSRYVHLVHDIADTGTRMRFAQFLDTREALLTSVRVTIYTQISTTINASYMVLAVPTQIILTTQSAVSTTTRHDT